MKTALVTGGGGFIGSHLVDRLLDDGVQVICVDNFLTGRKENVAHLQSNPRFTLIEADVSQPTEAYLPQSGNIDMIFHLASPASPRGYQEYPIETYSVNSFGTHHLLTLAKSLKAKFLLASTSEVYGDPLEHPQVETYWGNVHTLGIRACYDESKRFGEMAAMVFHREFGVDVRIIRIFNTYGPRMDPKDGRVIPNFVMQALRNKPITVYGNGKQTRSLCYVSDMVEGMLSMMNSQKACGKVYNIGNPDEYTVLDLANIIKKACKSSSQLIFSDLPEDDPSRRKPDVSLARKELHWQPKVTFEEGLPQTIAYFRTLLNP
ncbi:MAG: NAD-dependent dehydratase [Candidatus Chisholmbacteria bacterium RIFCSPLOWO2_01_FULL_49_14]|uniref:UDP-glucuronate decarboxylase n=1 Tax=Candidatus Chisholmbacteria bacterium RIFCSPLOWO2_01_FULL_49_14 TaxID=1797593 RepID=A0A1G1W2V3_9BACT|nr:MAG: NAD-dependent dehydratase [Candidatus Chisholmbacteria bacterium RIFCSPLOWO2_01_FULL_49_14]